MQPKSLDSTLEKMNREEFASQQWQRLKYQLHFIYQRSSFFRQRFAQVSLTPEDIKTPADFRRLPLLTKADLVVDQQENPPYGTRLCVPMEQINQTILTSGTTGLGQEVYALTRADIEYGARKVAWWLQQLGLRKGDNIMLTWPIGTNSGPNAMFQGSLRLGGNTFPIALYDTGSKLKQYMLRFDPHCLVVTPAYLANLTVQCEEMGIVPSQAFPNLKAIIIGTEAYPISWIEAMQKLWGCKLFELYGSTQQGAIAGGTCEHGALCGRGRGLIHLDEFGTYWEILDSDTGEPVKDGEEGEIVLTSLFREATPVLRFKSADKVRYLSHSNCPCKRPFDGIEAGTVARYDDMIKIKSQNVWPAAVDSVVFSIAEIEEYNGRVIVDDLGREKVLMQIEFRSQSISQGEKERLVARLSEDLRNRIGVTMHVSEAPHGTLERFIFKTRRWTDERKKGLERVKYSLDGVKSEKS